MPDFSNVPNFHLKLIFMIHFVFTSLSCIGHWSPPGYLFYNLLLILLMLWAMQNTQSADYVQLAFVVNVSAVVLDIFVLAFCYPDSYRAGERVSAAIAILHLVARPFTTIYLVKLVRERTGDLNFMANVFPTTTNAPRAESYEDIDRSATMPRGQGASYDFQTAQQI